MEVLTLKFFLILIAATVLFTSSLVAWAGASANIQVPKAGSYYYWLTYTDINGKEVATGPKAFKEKKVMAELPLIKDAPVKSTLSVLDAGSGNETVSTVTGKSGGTIEIKLASSDFNRVRRLEVLVISEANQQPAAAAIVKLDSKDSGARTAILDPSSKGTAIFNDVPAGTAKITVEYGDGKSSSQDADIALERKTPVLTVKVPVVGEIETVQAAASHEEDKDGKSSEQKGEESGKGLTPISAMVGLILVALVFYAFLKLIQSRGGQKALQQAGIDVSGGMTPAASSGIPVDSSTCPFCGGKKDPVTGACACSVGSAGASTSEAAGSGPRLIATQGAHTGTIYAISSDTITLGRDQSNAVALTSDNTASRRHARITNSGGQFTVYDEGSSNGTFVNGVKVTDCVLHPGDVIQVGSTKLRFDI